MSRSTQKENKWNTFFVRGGDRKSKRRTGGWIAGISVQILSSLDFIASHNHTLQLTEASELLYESKWSLKASLQGTRIASVTWRKGFCLASPGAPCSSPGGQSWLTLPPSRHPDPPAGAAALGRSSFGPLCHGRTAPPLWKRTTNKCMI